MHIPSARLARSLLVAALLFAPRPARAATLQDTLNKVTNDLNTIFMDGPVYLASRLPVAISGGNFLSSMELAGPKNFTFGLSFSSAVLTSFDKLGDNFQLFPRDKFPKAVPLPLLNFVARIGIIKNLDAGVRVGFFPEIGAKYKDITIGGAMLNLAFEARYRVLVGSGAKPDLVVHLAFSNFTGYLKIGKNWTFSFDETIGGTRYAGDLSFDGAPILGWTLYQLTPTLVARWSAAFFHPYLGLGVDFTFGHIDAGADMKLTIDLQSPEKTSTSQQLTETVASGSPRVFGLRPVIGFEFDLTKRLKLVVQADLGFYVRQSPGDLKNPGLEPWARQNMPDSLYVKTLDGEPLFPFVFAGGLGVRYDYH